MRPGVFEFEASIIRILVQTEEHLVNTHLKIGTAESR
jgi:hypothetical protein